MRTQRSANSTLTLLDIARWSLAPQAGLDQLRKMGRIDTDAIKTLNGLAGLIEELCGGKIPVGLDVACVVALTSKLNDRVAVDEGEIDDVDAWLGRAVACLRKTKRQAYRDAISRMISRIEAQELMTALEAQVGNQVRD